MAEHLEDKTTPARGPSPLLKRVSAAIAIAIAAVAITWAVVWRGGSSPGPNGPTSASSIKPVALNAPGLRALARVVPQPIFWAGPKKHYLYELTRQTNGNVYIRYLPPGVNAGAPGAKYLVIATYPFKGAFAGLKAVSHGKQIKIGGGGIALVDPSYPKSIHLAYPGFNYEIEIYDPSPAEARAVALSGAVVPVR
jgi:hypothetical protein